MSTEIRAFYSDSEKHYVRMDASTFSLQTVDYEHHEIHAGSHYFIANGKAMSAGETATYSITTPDATKWPHVTFKTSSTDSLDIELFEGATGLTAGTAVTAYNNNRNSANTSNLTITRDASATDNGTAIYTQLTGGVNQAGGINRENEILLKQDTDYMFVITSNANSNRVSWLLEWYEHTHKA